MTFDPVVTTVDADLASRIVWLDSLLLNVDRTARNTNLLWWHKEVWVIDHGASLYFHHSWTGWETRKRPFPRIKDHVLLPAASKLEEASVQCRQMLANELVKSILGQIPDDWLDDHAFDGPAAQRDAYYTFLTHRINDADFFVEEANYARAQRI